MNQRPVLLLVDDEPSILRLVQRFGERAGFSVITFGDGAAAIEALSSASIDVALVDLRMPHVGGIEVLRAIRAKRPACQVVLMTGYATIDSAVEAVKLGALDYLTKPLDWRRLEGLLGEALDETRRRRRLMAVARDLAQEFEFCGMIGVSPVMQEVFSLIRRIAPHVQTALITGETGTGKELAATALHQLGPRRQQPLTAVNCSAVVDSLFESELFGHVRGAFTGAVESKAGLFERADGGTLFLDEVAELPLGVQAKLLRVLETGEIQRVGAAGSKRVDVTVIAATNRDIRQEVAAGHFRADLYYRLNVVELRLPPLRERREDIPYLTAEFARRSGQRIGKRVLGITAGAERLLVAQAWPGNIRELRNTIERACMMTTSDLLTEQDLQPTAVDGSSGDAPRSGSAPTGQVQARFPACSLADVEATQIQAILQQTGGNKKQAARLLGISRRALYRRLDRMQRNGPGGQGAAGSSDGPTQAT